MTTSRIRPLMKKVLRRASYVLAALVVAVGALALYVQIDGVPRYTPETPVIDVARTPASIARGRTLVTVLCIDCHQDRETGRLTGRHLETVASEFGDIYSKNITGHPDRGIGKWTDGQLIYFLRTGVRPDGQYVPPWMPKLPHVSDEDIQAIVAFLRSGEPWSRRALRRRPA
jgi:mono/diheme cytochrome c family protein